jgi:hypothetical protein
MGVVLVNRPAKLQAKAAELSMLAERSTNPKTSISFKRMAECYAGLVKHATSLAEYRENQNIIQQRYRELMDAALKAPAPEVATAKAESSASSVTLGQISKARQPLKNSAEVTSWLASNPPPQAAHLRG